MQHRINVLLSSTHAIQCRSASCQHCKLLYFDSGEHRLFLLCDNHAHKLLPEADTARCTQVQAECQLCSSNTVEWIVLLFTPGLWVGEGCCYPRTLLYGGSAYASSTTAVVSESSTTLALHKANVSLLWLMTAGCCTASAWTPKSAATCTKLMLYCSNSCIADHVCFQGKLACLINHSFEVNSTQSASALRLC